MNILIATPLFPPDTAESARYVKELARRLSKDHAVHVLLYGYLPERVAGVAFTCVDKRWPTVIRLLHYFMTLWREIRRADLVFAENGSSVELPVGLMSLLTNKPVIFHIGDKLAHASTRQSGIRRCIEQFVRRQACQVFHDTPPPQPEILPFKPYPREAFAHYESSWQAHITLLTTHIRLCLKS